jgi:hypothetical protein
MCKDSGELTTGPTGPVKETGQEQILRTGTYCHTYCPACGADLIENLRINFLVTTATGEAGRMKLSPRFNVFEESATIELVTGTVVADLRCPHCEASLLVPDKQCSECGATALKLRISAVHQDFDLYLCTKVGCHWHDVSDDDRRRLVLEQSG